MKTTRGKPKNSKKAVPSAKKAKRSPAKKANVKRFGARADFGAPVEGFFAKQPPELRAVLDDLKKLVEQIAPDATASIKWGMPFYTIDGAMMCAFGGHKSHVNLILAGPPGAFADPEGRLSGEGKTGRHLKLTTLADLPRAAARRWIQTAAELARKKM